MFNRWKEETGQALVEYALLVGVLVIGILPATYLLQTSLMTLFSDAASTVGVAPEVEGAPNTENCSQWVVYPDGSVALEPWPCPSNWPSP